MIYTMDYNYDIFHRVSIEDLLSRIKEKKRIYSIDCDRLTGIEVIMIDIDGVYVIIIYRDSMVPIRVSLYIS